MAEPEIKKVIADEENIRLDRWVRRYFPDLPQGAIQKFCRKGEIRVNGKKAETKTRLSEGDEVKIPQIKREFGTRDKTKTIDPELAERAKKLMIYEDKYLAVMNKPSGLSTQGGTGLKEHVDLMLDAMVSEDGVRPRLVHRLDKDTSGVLLIAKTPGVAASLAEAFRQREVEKKYWAVVVGRPEVPAGKINQPLAKIGAGAASIMAPVRLKEEGALYAVSFYETLDHAGKKFAWLELSPETGRTHQLRVHCEVIETPILGDPRYGGEKAHQDGFIDRLHLHARFLDFPHPKGGRLQVTAPLPPHMVDTFKQLGFCAGQTPKPRREK
ncbi:RluA family pseudouridine synthase [Acetobacteraceae bacterium]|nr:RluA family pseudouridine synthase [Acetobacteraceae bacterium]